MTGLTRYDVTIDPMTIQLVSRTKVITITKIMLKCDTFLKGPCLKVIRTFFVLNIDYTVFKSFCS